MPNEVTLEISYDDDGNPSDVNVDAEEDVTIADLNAACRYIIQAIDQETSNMHISELSSLGGDEDEREDN